MTSKLLTEPVSMAVSLADARTAARLDNTELDVQLEIDVRAITKTAEHETGRSLVHQTWRVTLDAFPRAERGGPGPIQLPSSPVVSVVLKFHDADDVEQTLDPADYIVDAAGEPGYLVPAPGKAWPVTAARINAVMADVVCGYGPDDTTTPPAFKSYILGKVAEQYLARAASPALDRLLWPYKVFA
jgi:uncharacterized phiE125 gp8 family phage protein